MDRLIKKVADEESTASAMNTSSLLSTQWRNPSDVLSVLLIIGGDIVQKALAEVSGGLFTPVCFSFGWVAYSFTALVNIFGDGRLLPEPDYPVKVYNLENGYTRENRHWVIGRLLRDNETEKAKEYPLGGDAIRISVFEAQECASTAAISGSGRVRILSIIIMFSQFGIAAIPIGLYREWSIMMITAAGTLLALATGALPQWRAEKLPAQRKSDKDFALTSGNGSRDIMIIQGLGNSLDLEELAAQESPRSTRIWEKIRFLSKPVMEDGKPIFHGSGVKKVEMRTVIEIAGLPLGFWITGILCSIFCLLWLALLITVAGLKSHSWFLLAVGGLGMFQNAIVSAISRDPEKRNLPLVPVDTILTRKLMDGLMDLEVSYPGFGRPLLKEFFPGELRANEIAWWKGNTDAYDNDRKAHSARRGLPRSAMPKFVSTISRKVQEKPATTGTTPVAKKFDSLTNSNVENFQRPKGSSLKTVTTDHQVQAASGPSTRSPPLHVPFSDSEPAQIPADEAAPEAATKPHQQEHKITSHPLSAVDPQDQVGIRDFAQQKPTRSMSFEPPGSKNKVVSRPTNLSANEIYNIIQRP